MRRTLEYIGAKPFSYRTRRLLPGDMITCSDREAKVWLRSKKFQKSRPVADLPPPPADLLAQVSGDDLSALRAEYHAKLGKRPFHGWGADALRQKIGEAE